jgi:hypothetical protein
MAELFSQISQQRDINYFARDFSTLKDSAIKYLKAQFPDTYNDFSDISSGIALIELVAYIGDILNFYLDKQFQELFLSTAQEEKNIISLAKNLAYTPRGKSASVANNLKFSFNYTLTGSSSSNLEFFLRKGTRFGTDNGITFELLEDLDTSLTTNKTTILDTINNVVSASFTGIKVASGITRQFNFNAVQPIPFLKITLPDKDILEIISVSSTDGNLWYQVDYLAQENVFVGTQNNNSASGDVGYVLRLKRVPRRFTVEREINGFSSLRFGSGIMTTTDAEFIPNPEDYLLPATLRGTISSFNASSIDPYDFINTRTLGMTPQNTTLNIIYRTGGGLTNNVPTNSINQILLKNIDYKVTGNLLQKSLMENTFKSSNLDISSGGENEESLEDIKENASAFFASQNRIVTLQDYVVRVMTLPTNYGSVFRATASKDKDDKLGVKLSIITRQSNGTLTSSTDSLKINVVNYLNHFKSWSENLNIQDARIVNFLVNFSIVTDKKTNNYEILSSCIKKLKDYFNIKKWNIGDAISQSLVINELHKINGVLAVPSINFTNINGTVNGRSYSNEIYNITSFTKNFIINAEADVIFECRYPDFDITGSIL